MLCHNKEKFLFNCKDTFMNLVQRMTPFFLASDPGYLFNSIHGIECGAYRNQS